MILEFLSKLTRAGYRIFSAEDAKKIALGLKIRPSSLPYILRSLSSQKLIRPLFRGHYVVEDNILTGSPLYEFEIAMYLAKGGAIGCWSAMSLHELTDQMLRTVHILAPYKDKPRSVYHYKIEGTTYHLIQIQQEHFWGIETKFIGESRVAITDLERTLIDGLIRPRYCGGFREVLSAFTLAQERMDVDKLVEYGQRCSLAVQKRLGWVLEGLSIPNTLTIPQTIHFDKLDVSAPRRGKQNTTWMIMENF